MTLDHLVYATPDLDASVQRIAELTGVRPVEGGRHPEPDTVRRHLAALGVELDVRQGEPGLTAVVGGTATLR
ncbi:MAG: hypothetical protein JWR24_5410 [Actinoallomurus sp.]|nr:hypothetical protein [Actinoallomurus sp.]